MNWLRRHRLLLQQQAALGLVLLALLSVAALLLAEWITGARPPSAELAIGRLLFLLLFVAATVGAMSEVKGVMDPAVAHGGPRDRMPAAVPQEG